MDKSSEGDTVENLQTPGVKTKGTALAEYLEQEALKQKLSSNSESDNSPESSVFDTPTETPETKPQEIELGAGCSGIADWAVTNVDVHDKTILAQREDPEGAQTDRLLGGGSITKELEAEDKEDNFNSQRQEENIEEFDNTLQVSGGHLIKTPQTEVQINYKSRALRLDCGKVRQVLDKQLAAIEEAPDFMASRFPRRSNLFDKFGLRTKEMADRITPDTPVDECKKYLEDNNFSFDHCLDSAGVEDEGKIIDLANRLFQSQQMTTDTSSREKRKSAGGKTPTKDTFKQDKSFEAKMREYQKAKDRHTRYSRTATASGGGNGSDPSDSSSDDSGDGDPEITLPGANNDDMEMMKQVVTMFSGILKKPDVRCPQFKDRPEDVFNHTLKSKDWMNCLQIPRDKRSKKFKETLVGPARKWYDTIRVPTQWSKMKEMFEAKFGLSREEMLDIWKNLKFNPDTDDIEKFLELAQTTGKGLKYEESHIWEIVSSCMPDEVQISLFDVVDLQKGSEKLIKIYRGRANKKKAATMTSPFNRISDPSLEYTSQPTIHVTDNMALISSIEKLTDTMDYMADAKNKSDKPFVKPKPNFKPSPTGFKHPTTPRPNDKNVPPPKPSQFNQPPEGQNYSNNSFPSRGRGRNFGDGPYDRRQSPYYPQRTDNQQAPYYPPRADNQQRQDRPFYPNRDQGSYRPRWDNSPENRPRWDNADRGRNPPFRGGFDRSPRGKLTRTIGKPVNRDDERCFLCYGFGHWYRDCPDRQRLGNYPKPQPSTSQGSQDQPRVFGRYPPKDTQIPQDRVGSLNSMTDFIETSYYNPLNM